MRPHSDTRFVWIGGSCSYGCRRCPIPAAAPDGVVLPGVQLTGLHQNLAAIGPGRLVVLVGGDPFLRPDLLRLLGAVKAAGCVPGLITTGRPLAYAHVREALRRIGLAYLRVQLFGIGKAHDRAVAVDGAFEQAVAGINAWLADDNGNCDVDVALSIRGRAMDDIHAEVESLAQKINSSRVQIVVALDPAIQIGPGESDSLKEIVASFATWNDDESRPLVAWEGLPGILASVAGLTVESLRPQFIGGTPKASCLGSIADLAARALEVRDGLQANSFNFIDTGVLLPWTATADECTAYRPTKGAAPDRSVWLVEKDQLRLYVSDTADFDRAQISRVKDEWEHVFVDRSEPGVLDDFIEGMRRVRVDPICGVCPNRGTCGRRFHVVEGPPYAREEAWIADYVSRLCGRVLDVGCGEQLYRDEVGSLVRSGMIQYVGLDPDDLSLSRVREAIPEGTYHLGDIEGFRGEKASYDIVLCLRSLNHVKSVDDAIGQMAELVRPGGQILIVECTPFALLRRAEQVAAADLAPRAGHQHLRNMASHEVLPFARRHMLRVVHHQPAARESTNEWILLLERDTPR